MIDLELLVRFFAVAEDLSFSRAAQRLGVDQPWLSRQIRKLEDLLGFAVFVRNSRQVSLTAEGLRLLAIAQDVVTMNTQTQRAIGAMRREYDTVIRLGMHPYVYWSDEIRAIRRRFETDVPGARLELTSNTSTRNIARLEAGSLDVALVIGDTIPGHFEMLNILQVRPSLLVPCELPLARRGHVMWTDIAGLRIAVADPKRHQADFDRIFGPFFANGAIAEIVREGPTAVHHYAAADRLAMVTIRNGPPGEGFARATVDDLAATDFALVRLKQARRGLVERFWGSARRAMLDGVA